MKLGKVHDDALMERIISACTLSHTDIAVEKEPSFTHYVKIKVEKSDYRLISVHNVTPQCVRYSQNMCVSPSP